jgi:hypothetical protein
MSRQNYGYWKKFEGKELALFTWEGKPYHSKQKVFCVKRLVSVQELHMFNNYCFFRNYEDMKNDNRILRKLLSKNDGFDDDKDFVSWFANYEPGIMAILHFTDFRY